MKKSILIIFVLSISLSITAQDLTKQREAGLVFKNLDNFGLTYKFGNLKSLWRINTLLIAGNKTDEISDSLEIKRNSIGFAFNFGKEFRKAIADNFEFRYGADLSFGYSQSKYDYNDKTVNNNDRLRESTTYQPGINLVLGFNYVFNDKFVIGAEILPSFSYITGTSVIKQENNNNSNEVKVDISGFNYGLSNTSALLSLSYRF